MARCLDPINLKAKGMVPCGRCEQCLNNYRSGWALRLFTEATQSKETYFITLTYNDKNVPIVKGSGNLYHFSLSKTDIQLFLKRLRKNLDVKLRYYLCGEYGTQGDRPHYHMLLYLKEKIDYNFLYDTLLTSWGKGFIDVAVAKFTDYSYICKYLRKGQGNLDYKILREMKNQLPDFALMSRNKGIGLDINSKILETYFKDRAPLLAGTSYILPYAYKTLLKGINLELLEEWQKETQSYIPPTYVSDKDYKKIQLTRQKFFDSIR